MVSMGRPSIFPPSSCENMKPCESPCGFGTMNKLRPLWPRLRSVLVRASNMSTSARAPKVHQVFTPLMRQPLRPSGASPGVAVVFTPATSLPKSGSVTATAARTSALASLGSHSIFCSSVPPFMRARARISGRVMSEPPMPSEPRDSSSVAMTLPMYSPSPPSL